MTTIGTETETEVIQYTVQRAALVDDLRVRDGDNCMYPNCGKPLDFETDFQSLETGDVKRRQEPTIDHWVPQWKGKAEGWTREKIWDIDNLVLMHKKCNAKKGDLIPNEDGTLPARPQSTFRYRRDKRANRSDVCVVCDNGHGLAPDEVCAQCGMNAQRFPRWAHVRFQDCDHELFWCIWCSIGDIPRVSSVGTAIRQGGSDEYGEALNSVFAELGHVGTD